MLNQPLVSVIIPAWNARAFLAQAIDSARRQHGVDVEIIVADDKSPDPLRDLVESLNDERVTYLRLGENRGPGGARNAALQIASGQWVAVLDADDLFTPHRLGALIRIAEAERADIVADDLIRTGLDDRPPPYPFGFSEFDAARIDLIDYATFAFQNRMFQKTPPLGYLKPIFRRSFLRRWRMSYDETLRIGEDYQIVAEALLRGAKYVHVRTAGYLYRSRVGSISHRLRTDELYAILAAEADTLRRFGDGFGPPQIRAFEARRRSVEEALVYVQGIEDLKAGRIGAALAAAARRPTSLPLFTMPLVARLKRLSSRLGREPAAS